MQRTSMELTFEIVLLTVIALLIVALSGLAIFLCRRRCKAVRHANHEEGTMVVINIDNGGDRKRSNEIPPGITRGPGYDGFLRAGWQQSSERTKQRPTSFHSFESVSTWHSRDSYIETYESTTVGDAKSSLKTQMILKDTKDAGTVKQLCRVIIEHKEIKTQIHVHRSCSHAGLTEQIQQALGFEKYEDMLLHYVDQDNDVVEIPHGHEATCRKALQMGYEQGQVVIAVSKQKSRKRTQQHSGSLEDLSEIYL
eukprot:m.28757 g.28757  ORF g.28757 m.28757 type:complete len:253 (+) comp8031_c0_seq1:380-1138(+)